MNNINLIKELIGEAIIVPEIKYLNFSAKEIEAFKDLEEINTIKLLKESDHINLNDVIKTEWRKNI